MRHRCGGDQRAPTTSPARGQTCDIVSHWQRSAGWRSVPGWSNNNNPMEETMRWSRRAAVAACLLTSSILPWTAPGIASCGAVFCTVNTQRETRGVWTEPGWRLDLRYEYTDQDQLRSGRNKMEPAGIPDTHDEIRTPERNLLVGVDYTIDANWAVAVQLPLYQYVNGKQLTADWSALAGLSLRQ
jgi:hypothetical protein